PYRALVLFPPFPTRRSSDLADRAHQRDGAALARRARRAEIGIGEDHECQRIEWRGEPVVKLGANLIGLIGEHAIVMGRIKKLPEDRKSTRLNSSHRTISYAV